jgi:proteasome lid subunit RPN8/RPN11
MIKIPQNIVAEIIKHAQKEVPLEACGYLAGTGDQIEEIFALANRDKSPEHFSFDPKEQFKAVKTARAKGLELLAVYHSHPSSPARLSKEDLRLAYDSKMLYVIYSLLNQELKAYKVTGQKPEEVEVRK